MHGALVERLDPGTHLLPLRFKILPGHLIFCLTNHGRGQNFTFKCSVMTHDSEEVGVGGGSVNGATKKKIVVAVDGVETRLLLLTMITGPERLDSVLGCKLRLDFLFVDLVWSWHGYQPNK